MPTDISRLQNKVKNYHQVLQNTNSYRQAWQSKVKQFISSTLKNIVGQTGLKATIVEKNNIENLEAIVLDLGRSSSGIAENIENSDVKRIMVKNNGAMIYQQLFNGKIMVMLVNPYIEGYGEAKSPHSLAILRPDEISEAAIFSHVESLLNDITEWEDYDDDDKHTKVAFQPIGFQHTVNLKSDNGNDSPDVTQQ